MVSSTMCAWLLATAMVISPAAPVPRETPIQEREREKPPATGDAKEPTGDARRPVLEEGPKPPTAETPPPPPTDEAKVSNVEGKALEPSQQENVEAATDSAETAKLHFLRAQELLEDERYADAAREFARSHAAVPTSVALYNMALAHERAEEFVQAILSYEEYLQREDVVEPRRSEVAEAVARLRAQVVEFSLATPEDIEFRQIRVNGEPVSVTDFPLMVMPGSIRIELVTARDGQVHVRSYEVQAGQRITVDLALFTPTATQTRRSTVLQSSASPSPSSRVPTHLFWAGVAATSASGLSILALGLTAQAEARRFSADLCPTPCSEDLRADHPYPAGHRDRAQALATATNVMIGVTVGLGVATLVAGAVALALRPRETRRARLRNTRGGVALSW